MGNTFGFFAGAIFAHYSDSNLLAYLLKSRILLLASGYSNSLSTPGI